MNLASAPSPTTRWLAADVARIAARPAQTIPRIAPSTARPLIAGLDLWDMWPLELADGSLAPVSGGTLWFVLTAPIGPDPDLRHHRARIRLVLERGEAWHDCGNALPDGFSPGSREWAGSARYDPQTGQVLLYYTAAGARDEPAPTFAQRQFVTAGRLVESGGAIRIEGWTPPREFIVADGAHYLVVDQREGHPGFIKGFRDPAIFRNPLDGRDYVVFTGSLQQAASAWNGCIGLARCEGDGGDPAATWSLLPPLIEADALNNEQERPHLRAFDGAIYLFWSTQRRVFAPGGPAGPNGLYGMVAPSLDGAWRPLNGTGLIAANPDGAPLQGYSWWVDGNREVSSFVDLPGIPAEAAVVDDPVWRRAHFGGIPAPRFRIGVDGDKAWAEN